MPYCVPPRCGACLMKGWKQDVIAHYMHDFRYSGLVFTGPKMTAVSMQLCLWTASWQVSRLLAPSSILQPGLFIWQFDHLFIPPEVTACSIKGWQDPRTGQYLKFKWLPKTKICMFPLLEHVMRHYAHGGDRCQGRYPGQHQCIYARNDSRPSA